MGNRVLNRGEVKSLPLRSGEVIRVEKGILWLTFDGENDDIILRRCDSWTAPRRGKAVVQAMEESTFRQTASGMLRVSLSLDSWRPSKLLTLKH